MRKAQNSNNTEEKQVSETVEPVKRGWANTLPHPTREESSTSWGNQGGEQQFLADVTGRSQPSASGWGRHYPRRSNTPPAKEKEENRGDYPYFRVPGCSRSKWSSRRLFDIKEVLPERSFEKQTWEPFTGLREIPNSEFELIKSIEEEFRTHICDKLYQESQEEGKFVRSLLLYHKAVESWQRGFNHTRAGTEFPCQWIITPEVQRLPIKVTQVPENYYQELRLQCWLYFHTLDEAATEDSPEWFIGDIQELYKRGLREGGPLDKYINQHQR